MIGVSFEFIGHNLKSALRRWNEEVELKLRNRISFATHILSVPFIIRSLFAGLRLVLNLGHILYVSIMDNTWTAPIIYFVYIIISDLLPITAQLASMLVVNDVDEPGDTDENESLVSGSTVDKVLNPSSLMLGNNENYHEFEDHERPRKLTSHSNALYIKQGSDSDLQGDASPY